MNDAELARITELINRQDYEQVEKACLRALKENPADYNANYMLGFSCRARGRFQEALKYYQAALRFSPDPASLWAAIGIAHQQLQQVDAAISAFRKSLELTPTIEAMNSLALTYKMRGDFQDAIHFYSKALEECINVSYRIALQRFQDRKLRIADSDGAHMTPQFLNAMASAVHETPYFTIVGNIGSVYEAAGEMDSAQYFHTKAQQQTPVQQVALDLLKQDAQRLSMTLIGGGKRFRLKRDFQWPTP